MPLPISTAHFARWLAFAATFCALFFATLAHASNHPYFSKHPQQEKLLEQYLRDAKLQPVELQPASLQFQLKDLQGRNVDLARYKGQILLMTRWATWCPACRSELPFKTRLRKAITHPRFQIIGISDEDADTVSQFQRQQADAYALSFIDPDRQTAKIFQGSGIPSTLIIDGWGWVIAYKTGGAPWDSPPFLKLFRYLLHLLPSPEHLEERAPAPSVRFSPTHHTTLGQIVHIPFSLQWNGEIDKYRRIAIEIPPYKGLRLLGIEASGVSVEQDGNHRQYTLRLQADQIGNYQLHPISMVYALKDYEKDFKIPIGTLTLKITAADAKLRTFSPVALLAGISGFLLLLLLIVLARRKQHAPSLDSKLTPQQQTLALLDQSIERLQSHLRSDHPLALIEEIHLITTQILGLPADDLTALREQIRYGGHKLTNEEKELLLHRLSLSLKDSYPAQSSALRHKK